MKTCGLRAAAEAKEKCTKSPALSSISSIDSYDALFIPGGHGIVFDGPGNKAVADLIAKFWQAGKIVSAVCHGPIALAGVQVDGKPLVSGKKVGLFLSFHTCVNLLQALACIPHARSHYVICRMQ